MLPGRDVCVICGENGHWAKDCKYRDKDHQKNRDKLLE